MVAYQLFCMRSNALNVQIKGVGMDKQSNKKECPEMPAWMESAKALFEEDVDAFNNLPKQTIGLVSMYRRAKNGCGKSSKIIAENYELGIIPGGPDLYLAMEWYKYSASLGSVVSAMRAVELQDWALGHNLESGTQMVQYALNIVLNQRMQSKEDWHYAATAALYLLERNPDNVSRVMVETLLQNKKFDGHPDLDRIANVLRKVKCELGEDTLSLTVAKSKIIEDGDFKAGIYKCLEKPLPLVPVPVDPELIKKTLDFEFPWFNKVNEQVYRQLVVAQLNTTPAFHMRPLLLAGLPGVGKTTWASRLASLCNVPFRAVMAAGGADSMFLRGLARGWSSSRPGGILQLMAVEGVANPLILIDELEKASTSNHNGRIWDVMLQMLEPATSRNYLDECLQVSCDLSKVSWIATANELSMLPAPLLDRFTVILVEPPDESHFMTLVNGAVSNFANELGNDVRMLPAFEIDDLDFIKRSKNPREINRVVRLILEHKLVEQKHNLRQ